MDREKFKQLKQRAETVRRQPGFKAEPEPLPAERLPSLVPRLREEIHTYHAELEIQNQELIEAQAGMIANLEKYRGLFEHLPVPAVLLDARGFISAANRVARRWFGDDVASPQRHVPLLRLFHADSRSALHRYMQQMPHDVQGGELLRLAVASDEPVWVQIQAVFVPDEAAETQETLLIFSDHTQAVKLRESEQRFHNLADSAPALVWVSGAEADMRWFNQQWYQFTGQPMHQADDDDWMAVLHADDRERCLERFRQACTDHQAFSSGVRVRRHDGRWRWMLNQAQPRFDEQGEFLGFVGVCVDQTEQTELMQRLDGVARHVPGMMFQYQLWPDGHSSFPYCSQGIHDLFDLVPEQVCADATPFFERIHRQDFAQVTQSIHDSAQEQKDWHCEYRVRLPEGGYRWVEGEASPQKLDNGCILWHGYIRDICERKKIETALRESKRKYQNLLDGISDNHIVYRHGADERMLYLSEGFEAITGLPRDQALGRNWSEVLAWTEETLQTTNELTVQLFNGEIDEAKYEVSFRHPGRGDLRTLRVSEHASFDEQGRLTFIDGIAEDITEQKRHQEQLEHLAQHDSLTDLPSRSLLGDRLHQAIARAPRHDKLIAVVYIDLDGFKAVNDTHGHAMGDILLVRLAQRLKQALREGDTLARVGGDEFVALLLDLENRDQSAQILERMLQAAAEPIQVEGRTLQVSASLGVAYYPQGEPIQADQLLQQADQAMYQAKQAGKNRYHLFDVQADQLVHGHMETIHALERALQRDELSLHYQPVVDLTDGRVIGAEALLHWVHPEHGLLPASSFLPLVNRYPLSIQLDDWVLQRVLEQIETWKATGLDLPLSLNLGPLALQLEQDDFVARLADALVRHPRVGKGDLILEVEEGHALQGQPQMDRLVRQCRQMGVGFVLDDFGTARAPLGFLKDLPSQGIKIAPSFVRNIPRDAEDLAILLALLGVAGAFRQKTIAEGVETLRHGALLLALGCGCAQGDAIARPMPAQALPQWLKGWQLPAQWQGLQVVSLQDREVLFALVEHQAWMDQLRQHLHTPHTEPPELDHRACLFARWSGKHGLRYRHEDGYARILELHEEIHRRAHQLLAQDRRNERQIEEGFQAIDGHKELLWHEMERLIFPSDMT